MSANKETIGRTVLVAFLMCLVCSVIVAGAAVYFKPIQQANKAQDKRSNILAAAGMLEAGKTVDEMFKRITTKVVNLETGEYVNEQDIADLKAAGYNPDDFNQRKSSKDPAVSRALMNEEDKASIKRLEKFATVYLLEEEGQIKRIILPVHGYGLWSTLYGFVALEGNAETISGMGFYSHAETPGLGGEVDNPTWKALWIGKKIHDENQAVAIRVIKGKVDPASPKALNEVDGLSGATLTSRGVSNLMQFWFGELGFAHYLNKLKAQGV